MSQKYILIHLLLGISSIMFSQTDFREGYVIRSEGDTLRGFINYQGDKLMAKVCTFKPSKTGKKIDFLPENILGYRFKDGKYFISMKYKEEQSFFEYLINGKIDFFYKRDSKGDHYYIEKEGLGLNEIPYEEGTKIKNDRIYEYKTDHHKALLNVYTQDAPKVFQEVINIASPSHKNLISLAQNYHKMVCNDQPCITYEKKLPILKIAGEVSRGFGQYGETGSLKKATQFGVYAHFWLPRANEKFFIKTGVVSSFFEDKITRLPFQIEYQFKKYRIQPKLAYGFYIPNRYLDRTFLFSGGLNLLVIKSWYVSLNYDIEFFPKENLPMIPKISNNTAAKFFSLGIYLGL